MARRLLEGGPASATLLAADLGLTPAAIRRHLDALEAGGLVTAHDAAPFGPTTDSRRGRGRPARVFALTAQGRDAFDHAYDDVALDALRFMAAHADAKLVREFASARANELASRYASELTQVPAAQRVERLAELLSADGFAANVQSAPGGAVQLCEHHCPVAHVASEFPEFCEAEQSAFSALLGVHTVRLSTIAGGADICTTHVPGATPSAAPGGAFA